MKRAVAMGLLPAFLGTACYTYRPVDGTVPVVGTEVRAHLSPPGSFQVGEFTIHDVNGVEGQVYQASGDTLLVWGSFLQTRIGSRYSAGGGSLFLSRQQVGSLEVRRLSTGRSIVAGVLTVGLVGALFGLVKSALAGSGPQPPVPEPN